jgi:two-component system OmpR family sensor kinase
MRRLSISLLIVVLLSTIGLGWAIDRLFVGLAEPVSTSFPLYRQLGAGLIAGSQDPEALTALVEQWPDSTDAASLDVLNMQELALPAELSLQILQGEPLVLESEAEVTLLFAIPDSDKVLSVSPPIIENEAPLRFLLTMLFYGGMALLVLLWIYPIARRLLALGRTARAFGEGRLEKRVSTHRYSFLYGIETEFNSMAQRIQSLVADNKILASAVSHDLRTPLARLRFGIDLLDDEHDEKVRAEYQKRLSNDLSAMESLVEVLLEYARLDQQLSDMQTSSIDLNSIVSDSVEAIKAYAPVEIDWHFQANTFVARAQERYVRMLTNNLLQNCANYGNGKIKVSLSKKRFSTTLTVEDNGPGIPAHNRDEMLKPFVRGQYHKDNKASKGFGMGLAIVSRIAQWHNAGFVISDSKELGGARFDIIFPSAELSSHSSPDSGTAVSKQVTSKY